jgi:hypothetical protein
MAVENLRFDHVNHYRSAAIPLPFGRGDSFHSLGYCAVMAASMLEAVS